MAPVLSERHSAEYIHVADGGRETGPIEREIEPFPPGTDWEEAAKAEDGSHEIRAVGWVKSPMYMVPEVSVSV